MTGWRCPGCSACYAPTVTECQRCAPALMPRPFTPDPYPAPQIAPWTLTADDEWCAFDSLPDGVYGIACPCSRHRPRFVTSSGSFGLPAATNTDAGGVIRDGIMRVGLLTTLS